LKRQAVIAYILGQWPATKVLKHFGIRGISQLEDWVRQYNGNKELTDTPSARRVPEMARKTTYEERVEIVEFVLANQRNYSLAAEKYGVTYQQVYLWVKKVDAGGFEALVDGRGRTKQTDEMSELEKANLRIRQLEAELKSKQMEADFAKKLTDILKRGR
jgi:transposase-like protein